ncbi:MAG: VWA domain-containing protein, partial [Chloroflexota bacterium]
PLEPAFRWPKRSRPDLCMLCDVSGSVAEFAEFTLNFLNAMNAEFSRMRCFAFIDGVDEVTDLFAGGRIANIKQLLWRRQLVWADGHSDYEHVFSEFRDRYGRACVGPKTTLIVTGDARNNFKGEDTGALRELSRQARRLVWLNPEARAQWDVGDSVMSRYTPWCHEVHEVRNLRQLAEFVLRLEA